MQIKIQKRLAATILKVSPKKIWLDSTRLSEIKEAITKADIRSLIKDHAIREIHINQPSHGRTREAASQRRKGRKSGSGSRKGRATARSPRKEAWINHIRPQRKLLFQLREKKLLTQGSFRDLYGKSKGGFFRSKRHLKLYVEEHGMLKK